MSQNYKDTLNLPRTDFPMKANLARREPELLKRWEETGVYRQSQKSRENAELFVLHDGPPFANGDVHMGTALNKILKDFVVKSQTMLGKRAPMSRAGTATDSRLNTKSSRNRATSRRWKCANVAKHSRANSLISSANNSNASAFSVIGTTPI